MSAHAASVALNREILCARDATALAKMALRAGEFNVVNAVSLVQTLARVGAGGGAARAREVAACLCACRDTLRRRCLGAGADARECQTRHVSSLLWALARLRGGGEELAGGEGDAADVAGAPDAAEEAELLDVTLQCALKLRPEWFKPQEVSISVWALGKLRAQSSAACELVQRLLGGCASAASSGWGAQAAANVLHGAGLLGVELPPGGSAFLARVALDALPAMSGQELANALGGLAKLDVAAPEGLWAALARRLAALSSSPDLSAQHAANIAWACAKLQCPPSLHPALAGLLAASPHAQLKPRELSMALWALPAAGFTASSPELPAVLPQLLGAARDALPRLSPQQLATIALALAKLDDATLAAAIAQRAVRTIDGFNAQDLDNVTTAAARFGDKTHQRPGGREREASAAPAALAPEDADALAAAVAHRAAQLLETKAMREAWSTRSLANLMWALAKLRSHAVAQRRQSRSAGRGRTRGRTEREREHEQDDDVESDEEPGAATAAAASDFAGEEAAELACTRFLARGGRAAVARLASFNARDLCNLAWGMATLRHLAQRAQRRRQAGGKHKAQLEPAGSPEVDLLWRVADEAARKLDQFNAQECSKLLFALRRAGVENAKLERAAQQEREREFDLGCSAKPISLRYIAAGGRALSGGAREATGTTGATGGALWQDSLALAEWMFLRLGSAGGPPPALEALLELQPGRCAQWRTGAAAWGDPRGLLAVELGAGLGLCAIIAACLGMDTVATDGDDTVLELLGDNLERNAAAGGAPGRAPMGSLRACKLEWGAPSPLEAAGLQRKPDLVLATGCVYGKDPQVWRQLLHTVRKLCGSRTLVVMAHGNGAAPGVQQMRGAFYEAALRRFDAVALPPQELPKRFQGCSVHVLLKKSRTAREAARAERGEHEQQDKRAEEEEGEPREEQGQKDEPAAPTQRDNKRKAHKELPEEEPTTRRERNHRRRHVD